MKRKRLMIKKKKKIRDFCSSHIYMTSAEIRGWQGGGKERPFNFVYASTLEDVNTISQFPGVIFF